MSDTGFAVLDFETTGFSPKNGDKVVEVGLVLLDQQGNPESTYSTLVNPRRDVGATKIHGITATDVVDAPTFSEIAPELLTLISGRVIVAHNANFDTRFLIAELAAAGFLVDGANLPVICTMRLASDMLPGVGRSLAACCEAYDIDIENAHSALDDALATAKLLRSYFDQEPNFSLWDHALGSAEEFTWPLAEKVSVPTKQRGEQLIREESVLNKYITRLPDAAQSTEERGLMRLFDDIFSDGLMTSDEANLIDAYVAETGISAAKLAEIKNQYFLDLVNLAWSDGVLNPAEIIGIRYVGELFGQSATEIDGKLAAGRHEPEGHVPEFARFRIHLDEGDLVVLTGEMDHPRSFYEEVLAKTGIVCWPSVTKKVKAVVAADVNSQSGKAKRARLLGIPVLSVEDVMEAVANAPEI